MWKPPSPDIPAFVIVSTVLSDEVGVPRAFQSVHTTHPRELFVVDVYAVVVRLLVVLLPMIVAPMGVVVLYPLIKYSFADMDLLPPVDVIVIVVVIAPPVVVA